MKAKLVFSSLILVVSSLVLRAAPVDDRIAEGRAALAAHDLATARAKFQQARTADSTNQTAAALSGLTRWFAMIGDAPANAVLNGLGVSITGRDVYNWNTDIAHDADDRLVLPNAYNLESTRPFWRDAVLPTAAAVRADFAAVTDDAFVLTLTPTEIGASHSVTLDRADLLVIQAGLRAFEMLVNAGLGQNFNADYTRLMKLAQGDVLTLRQALEENPDLLKAGPLENRQAAKQALIDFVTLYRRASAAVRSRAPGVDRMFMLQTEQDFSDEAEFRQHLSELEKAATDYVELNEGNLHVSLAPTFTSGWSLRGSLPAMTNGRFDPLAIADASLGGVMLGTSREFFARALVEAGYSADLGWTRLNPNPVSGPLSKYAYSGTHHVVTGINGTIGRSADGVNWTFMQLPNSQDLFSIASNGAGVLVAEGNTQIWRSADHGATWKLVHTTWRGSAPDNEGGQFGMVWDGTRFVSITASGYIWSSSDLGLTWKRGNRIASASATLSIFGLDYANGLFVATGTTVVNGGTRSAIFTSTNGTGWTLAFTGATSNFYRTATFGAGKWIVVGNSGRVAYSTNNGVSWAEVPIGVSTDFFAGSTFTNNTFVVSGARTGTSSDGVNWTFASNPENGISFADAVAAPDGFTYLPGPQGALYRFATNGSFTRLDGNATQFARNVNLNDAVVFQNKLYVAGTGGMVYESADGNTFTARPTSTTNNLTTLAVHGGVLYAGGAVGTIVASSDGATWETRISNDSALTIGSINRLASLNGLLLAGASNGVVLTSSDGSAWTRRALPNGGGVASLAYGGGYYVVGLFGVNVPTNNYTEGAIYFSTDTVTWTRWVIDQQPGLSSTAVRAIVFDQGQFYYFLTSGRVLRTFSANPSQGWESIAGNLGTLVGAARLGAPFVAHVQRSNDESRASLVYTFEPDSDGWVRTELPSSEFPVGAPTQFNNRLYYVGGGGGIYRANKPLARPAPVASTPLTFVGQIGRNLSLGAPFATSEELNYQWFYNGTAIAGASSATLDLANLTNGQAGTYTVVATGRATGGTATNNVTVLVVNGPPSITQQPTGGVAAAGTAFTFGVAASGSGPISYQWFKNNTPLNGATSTTLAFNAVPANDAGSYRVEVTNTYGTVVSSDAQLSVSTVGAAPAFWDDTEANMYSPSRVFSDGNGRLFMTWNVVSRAQDVVAGIRVGSLFRLDEATGAIDPTFVWDERLGSPLFVAFQPDGKLLVAVNHAYGEGATVVRVNADGSWDDTYTAPRFSRSIRFIHRQADGKLLVSASDLVNGNALLPAGSIDVAQPTIYRLNTDGSSDNSFTPVVLTNGGTIFCPPVTDAAGNVYVVGNFSAVNGTARRAIARVNSSGVLDSMGDSAQLPAGWSNGTVARAVIFQSDGRAVIVGRFGYTARGNTSSNPILAVRFNTDGTFDDAFARPLRSETPVDGSSGAYARYAVIDANDKFLVTVERLLRFNADGTLDGAWPTNGTGYNNRQLFWICRSATSGNLYVPDLDNNTPGNILALTSSGAPLDGFNTGGFGSTVVPDTAILLNDGRVLAAGTFDHFGDLRQPGTALFGATGLLAGDSTAFHNPGVLLQNPYAYVFQWPDRSFGVVRVDFGEQQTGAGSSDPTFVRYNADGSARGNWHFPDDPTRYNYAALPDGGVIAWRSTLDVTQYSYFGTSDWVRRYNADGSYDPSFAPDLSGLVSATRDASNFPVFETATISDVQVAGDGSIFVLLGGRDGKMTVYKLRSNGTLDPNYTPTPIADAPSSAGFSTSYFDPVVNSYVQATITSFGGANIVFRVLPDGSAWVAGTLNIGGTARNVARLTAAGTVDANVPDVALANNAPLGLSAFANALGLDDSGRIYLAGRFDTANGNAAAGIIRFATDGSLDTAWSPGVQIRDPLARGTKLVAGRGWLHLLGPVAAPSDVRPVGYKRVAIANVTPVIVGQSTSRTIYGGQNVQLFAGAFGGNGATYAWTHDGQPVLGAVGPFLNLGAVTSDLAGTYRLTVTNNVGSAQTTDIVLTFSNSPLIVAAPQSQTVTAGASVTLKVKAVSATALSYQWKHNGSDISGATGDSYTIASASNADAGDYTVVVTNAATSVESATATLTVNAAPPAPDAPTIAQQPLTQTVYSGYSVTLGVTVTAPSGATITTYQWYQNNSLYSTFTANGATNSSINVSAPNTGSSNSYYVVVTASNGGKTTSNTATLTGGTPLAVNTVAGASSRGISDGTGSAARFSNINGAVGDGVDNLYVADSNNHTIRKITTAGVVTTFAGSPGNSGTTDGTLATARFSNPQGIALDSSGNFYVVGGNLLRKISNGNVTTLAGSSSSGNVDATGTAARFNFPTRVAVDGAGNVYVSDSNNHSIRKVTPAGVVTTYAGSTTATSGSTDGVGTAARFSGPRGLAALADGTLFVADSNNHTIRRIATDGTVTTIAGSAGSNSYIDNAIGTSARFSSPQDIFYDGANALYVADFSQTIRKVDLTPGNNYAVTTIAGTAFQIGFADGGSSVARFNNPRGMGWMGSALGVVDGGSNTIRAVTPDSSVVTLAGVAPGYADGTGTAARFFNPEGIARDSSGNLYVAESGNHVIRKVTTAGVVSLFSGVVSQSGGSFVDGSAATARFAFPRSLTIDPTTGILYVFDNGTIRQVATDGSVSLLAGSNSFTTGYADGTGNVAKFSTGAGIAFAPSGDLYVTDTNNHVIRKVTTAGVVTTVAGLAGSSGTVDGSVAGGAASSAVRLNFPQGIAVDSSGNIFFAQSGSIIRKIDTAGNVTTVAGLLNFSSQLDGAAPFSRLPSLTSLAIGPDGNLYAGGNSGALLRVMPSGTVTMIAGGSFTAGYVDGQGSSARFDIASGFAFAPDGTIFVADRNNSVVRRVYAGTPLSIVSGPIGGTVLVGANITLSVVANSTATISYQWMKNGTDISGATNATLPLTNLATTDSGTYSVRLSAGNTTLYLSGVNLTVSQPIANDSFANAFQLAGLSGTTSATSNAAATSEAGEPTHWNTNSVSSSLWYSYRPIATGVATFDTGGSAIDTAMAVYTGNSLASLAFLAQNNDAPTSTASRIAIPVTAGTTYYVAVGSNGGTRGNIVLNYSLVTTPEPAIAIATVGQGASLTVQPDAANNVGVQWARETVDLAGSTAATLTQSTAGVYSAGFVVGANPADYTGSVPAVLLSVPAGSVTATDFFGGTGLDTGWNAMQETSWPESDTELAVARGRLNYGTAYATSWGYRVATRVAPLPLDRNWTVIARLGLQGGNIAGTGGSGSFRLAGAQLSIVNLLDPADRLDTGFRLVNDAGTTTARTERYAQAQVNNGMPSILGIADLAANAYLVRVSYDSTTGNATVAYSTGAAFATVGSTNLLGSWGNNRAGFVTVALGGLSSNLFVPTGAVWADDFANVVEPPAAAAITAQPTGGAFAEGSINRLSVNVSSISPAPITYQWFKDGVAIADATNNFYDATAAGSYTVTVTQNGATTTSDAAVITLSPSAPAFFAAGNIFSSFTGAGGVLPAGSSAALSVTPAGGSAPLSYQWQFNNVDIPGATDPFYFIADWQKSNEGLYSVRITNSLGNATSPAEPFFVTPEGGWRWRNPTPTGNGSTRVAFIGGQFLMSGIRGTLLASNDGLAWTTRQIPAQNNIFKLVTLGDRLLAMGSLNGMFTSRDAVTWETHPTGINGGLTQLQDMVAGGGRVVAFGTGGVTAVSTDGLNWTPGTLGTGVTDTLFGATYVLNKFYGVSGSTGKVFSSPDGVTWSSVASGATSLQALAYGAGRLVAVGENGQIVVSANGTSWTPVSSGTTAQFLGVNFVNNRFVAVGVGGTILTSPDGLIWTARSAAGNTSNLQNTAFGAGRYVIAGQSGRVILTSTDAENWNILTAGPYQGTHLNGVAASGSVAVAVGDAGAIVSSSDGAAWTARSSGTTAQLVDVTFAAGKFVAVGGGGSVLVSTDGASWSLQATSNVISSSNLQGLRYSGGFSTWIVVGNGGNIFTAPDATPPFTWTKQTSGTTAQLRRVAHGGGLTVAVGGNGTIVSASNPTGTWTVRTSNTTAQFNDVVYGGGAFVAVGTGGTISRSTDAANWTTTTLGTLNLLSVTYLNGHFVATGPSNNYYTSTDGIAWTGRTTGAADQLNDTVLFNGQVVGVGRFGTVLTADTPVVQGGGTINADEGAPATIKFAISNSPFPVTYSWFKDAQPISGPNAPVLRIAAVAASDAGAYTVQATNAFGSTTSATPVTLALNVSLHITAQPAPQTATVGGSATFNVTATGVPAPTYQWRFNGAPISGATTSTLTLNNLRLADNGTITVAVTNAGGTLVSNGALLTVNPLAPVITSPLSANAVANAPFRYQIGTNQTLAQFGATGLPNGLSLNQTTGVIEGTPTQTGTFNVALTATNATGSDQQTLVLSVQPPAPIITSPASASGRVGQSFTYTITATNSPTGYGAATLPPGLTLSGATISGTPTAAGFYTASVSAQNATGTSTQSINIQIAAPLNAPVFTGGSNVSGTAGTSFSFTPNFGSGITAWALVNLPDGTPSTLPTGLSFNTGTGAITGNTAQTGTFKVAIRATNADGSTTQVVTFTINPAASAPAVTSTGSTVGTVGSAFTFTITTNPAATGFASTTLPGGLTLNATTGAITGVPTDPGISNVTLTLTNSAGSSTATLMITINSSALAPVITNSPIATGTAGSVFNFTLTGSNSPTSFAVVSGTLPAGLSLNTSTGAITGTPSAAGQTRVWVAASNGAGGRGPAVEMLFDIARALTVPLITSNGTAAGQVGQPFQYQIIATNAPTSYAATALPNGLSFSTSTGIISGLPTVETTTPFEVTLTASNADGTSAPKTLAISISPAPATPKITSPLAIGGRVGNAFTYQITATESPTSFTTDQLPDGLTLNSSTGVISGTPTVSGTISVQLRAANAAGLGQASTLTIDLAAPLTAPAITSDATANGKVGTVFTYQIVATNSPTSYGLSGTLPAGLAINTTTGLISGNPADNPGLYTVTLTAMNAAGTSQPQTLLIGIAPADNAPVITSPTNATGMVSVAFTYQITATNVPNTTPFPPSVFLDAVNLPPGLAVNASTGLIQGTPSAAGTYLVSLVGVNANGTGLPRTLTLTISPAPNAPVVNSPIAASAQAGTVFSYQITATNNPTAFEALDAPAWLSVNTGTGLLSGTPPGPGTIALRVGASNAGGSSTMVNVTVSIAAAPNTPVVTSSRSASGRVGQAFSYDITASLTPTSYVVSGLPAGLTVDTSNGQIRGTPTASGTFNVVVSGVNANGQGQPITIQVTISPSVQIVGG
ncbi:MAG: immunoglobulin domain-containing protein [Opitutae bacterium]|nr:immunoglobulin domain-containing protein [Opitutae bacterium]